MRHYEVMIILDPTLDERTVAPSLEGFLDVIRKSGGDVEKVDIWGRRRLSYEINKHAEGIYALVDVNSDPDAVKELDRQLSLTENVLRTKVLRRNEQRAKGAAAAAASLAKRNARTSKSAAATSAASAASAMAAAAPKAD